MKFLNTSEAFETVSSLFWNPIGVYGASRSGTTILRRAIGKHPQILGNEGESPYIRDVLKLIDPIIDEKRKSRYFETSALSLDEVRFKAATLIFESLFGFNFGINSQPPSIKEMKMWCGQLHVLEVEAKSLITVFPELKLIHIVRSGIDAVDSMMKRFTQAEFTFELACDQWAAEILNSRWVLDSEFSIEIRHEHFVYERQKCFENIFDFIQLPYDSRPCNFALGTIIHPQNRGDLTLADSTTEFESRLPCWKNWPNEWKSNFKNKCSEAMSMMSYEIPF